MRLQTRPSRLHGMHALVLAWVSVVLLFSGPSLPAADGTAAAAFEAPAWKAVAASGQVEARAGARPQDAWQAVSRGDSLLAATLVRTGRSGRATLAHRASLIVLDPESRVELPAEPRPGMDTSVIQRAGSVLYEVDSRANPHFEVVTPYLVAGVKGTEFLVTVDDAYTAVTVQRGLVEVTNPDTGESRPVGPGETLFRERDQLEMGLIDRGDRVVRAEVRREKRKLASLSETKSDGDPADDATAEASSEGSDGSSGSEVDWVSVADWVESEAGVGVHADVDPGRTGDVGGADIPPYLGDGGQLKDDDYFDDDALICEPTLVDCSGSDGSNTGDDGSVANPGDTTKPIDPVTQDPVLGGDPGSAPPVAGPDDPGSEPGTANASPSLLQLLDEQTRPVEEADQESEQVETKRRHGRGHVRRSP